MVAGGTAVAAAGNDAAACSRLLGKNVVVEEAD